MAKHNILGQKGEEAACETLLRKGYIIRDRNWRSGKNEIDIVAEKDGRIIVVEVKTRTGEIDDISQLIPPAKIRHIVNAGKAYLKYFGLTQELQFDIILLHVEKENLSVEHIEDAIMPPMYLYL